MKVLQESGREIRFRVNPRTINETLFVKKRVDEQQEKTRLLISEAIQELHRNPEEYGCDFEIMIPKKNWNVKSVGDLKTLATKLGDHMANYIEWGLALAQKITNGETWESLCNMPDIADWYRIIVWRNGHARIIGGASCLETWTSEAYVREDNYYLRLNIQNTVPLVVCYD